MGKRKFEFKRYDYLGENKYRNALNAIMSKKRDWWDVSEYTWDVHTWIPITITTTNVPTITTTTTAGEESTRYYNRLTSTNTLYYMDFPDISNTVNNTISVSMDNGWRVL